MLRGLYTAATGMNLQLNREDAVANNLANINTIGYKKDEVTSVSFHEELFLALDKYGVTPIGRASLGVEVEEAYTHLTPGNYITTGNALDLSITGDGYFLVESPSGRYLTRNGDFSKSVDGYLVTSEGDRVIGENGPVWLGNHQVNIGKDGTMVVDGQIAGRLLVVLPTDQASLVKEGSSRFRFAGGWTRDDNSQINQGEIENSNVNPIEEMAKMIEVTRAYESNQKVIAVMDEVMNKIANEIGRV
jgi:flagellar basal-body rod protein FlgG